MKAEYRPEDASKLFITRKTPAKCQPSSLQRTSNGEYTILKINSLHFDTMICITIAWFYALKVKWMGKIVSAFNLLIYIQYYVFMYNVWVEYIMCSACVSKIRHVSRQ